MAGCPYNVPKVKNYKKRWGRKYNQVALGQRYSKQLNIVKLIKKKIRFVLIGFIIALIPIGYWIYSSLMFEKAIKAFNEGNFSENNKQIENCIKEIDKALRIMPWNKNLNSWKSSLNLKVGNYRKALDNALKVDAFLYAGMIYEYMEKPDSARIFYKKAIKPQIKQMKKLDDNETKILVERQIALIYNFIGDSDKVDEYLRDIPAETNYQMRKMILHYDYYIENYQSGGYKDFLYGKKICMKNDSLTDKFAIDSLLDAKRLYYDNYSSRQIKGHNEQAVYEFKEIFKDKATSIGFKEIDCSDSILKMKFNQEHNITHNIKKMYFSDLRGLGSCINTFLSGYKLATKSQHMLTTAL